MKVFSLPLEGAKVIECDALEDARGRFLRCFCQNALGTLIRGKKIEQVNFSLTIGEGTVRGMHFQHPPRAEQKFVRCLRGCVFDVVVDLRRASPTFLRWHGEILSEENMKMMFVPEGFAHGFQAQADCCEMLYLHTAFYSPGYEGGVRYDDPAIGIAWSLQARNVSGRDAGHELIGPEFEGVIV